MTYAVPTKIGTVNPVAYMANYTAGVLAPTLEAAVAQVRGQFPDCVIWSVNHRGKIHFDARQESKP